MTPEKLQLSSEKLLSLHRCRGIGLLAIDEAHCASQWGNGFRPEYAKIGGYFRAIPGLEGVPIMALTATSTAQIREDLTKTLQLKNVQVFRNSVDRPNLRLSVHQKNDKSFSGLLDVLRSDNGRGSTIIYAPLTSMVDELVNSIKNIIQNTVVMGYHGKMSVRDRENSHRKFLTGECPIICATVAFGMGIDKPDVRRVVLYGPPKDMETYYQVRRCVYAPSFRLILTKLLMDRYR